MSDFRQQLGFAIRGIRRDVGLSQQAFSARVGLRRWETLSNYERGKTEAPVSVLVKIAQVFGVPITDLIPALDQGDAFSAPPGTGGPGKVSPAAAACLDMLARSRALEDPVFRQIIGLLVEFMSEPKTAESEQEE